MTTAHPSGKRSGCVARWLSRNGQMSDRWLKELRRRDSRIEYHGPRWPWPLQKAQLDCATFNRWKLRRKVA